MHEHEENAAARQRDGWRVALPPRGGARVLLAAKEGPLRQAIHEALAAGGHDVRAAEPAEAAARCRHERFEVALLLLAAPGTPALMRRLAIADADLEIVWAPPPLGPAQALELVGEAAQRSRRRLSALSRAARTLLDALPPDEATARLVERAEQVLAARVALRPHWPGEPAQVLIDPARRRLRVPLWESGPAPEDDGEDGGTEGEDGGHRLEFVREDGEPPFSRAEVKRAAVLSSVASLALRLSHGEQALCDLYRELAGLRAQLRQAQGGASLPADPLAGRGLTSGAIGPLERLAGVLAHELNNPLTFVLANLTCLQEEHAALGRELDALPGSEAARARWQELGEVLHEAMGGAGRVREVVADLTTLGTRGEPEGHQRVIVEEVVRAALRIARREVQRRAQVVVDIAPRLPAVVGSASKLGQVVLNLLLNAVQAVPLGQAEAHQVRVVARAEGDRVALHISDTGTGIPPERLPRVFEPGFTTKPTGEGSGLGLAISREIVRAHNGDIHIASQPGAGTTVTVLLPAADAAQPAASP